ncbi:unnamed protein product [Diabrotica balteata]|uniref:Uncharacterized protein n=1 Tax=Diabrotica balteata TaxID=107213 RepID=A0A9N9SS48_DIABA|nr:unnamed protein product [Diabrotica balteata]
MSQLTFLTQVQSQRRTVTNEEEEVNVELPADVKTNLIKPDTGEDTPETEDSVEECRLRCFEKLCQEDEVEILCKGANFANKNEQDLFYQSFIEAGPVRMRRSRLKQNTYEDRAEDVFLSLNILLGIKVLLNSMSCFVRKGSSSAKRRFLVCTVLVKKSKKTAISFCKSDNVLIDFGEDVADPDYEDKDFKINNTNNVVIIHNVVIDSDDDVADPDYLPDSRRNHNVVNNYYDDPTKQQVPLPIIPQP